MLAEAKSEIMKQDCKVDSLDAYRCFIKEFFTQRIKVPQVESQCREVHGDVSREVKNKLEAQFQCLCLQEGRQPWILSYQRKFHRILLLYSKDCKYRSFSLIISPHLQRFHVGRWDSTHQVSCCSPFSLGGHVMDQISGDRRFSGWVKIIVINEV